MESVTESILSSSIEVGIGIVGFAGLVLTLSGAARSKRLGFEVSALLLNSIALVLFSFLPFILVSFNLEGDALWRAASIVFLVLLSPVAVYRAIQIRRLDNEMQFNRDFASTAFGVFGLGSMAMLLLQLLNAVWIANRWPYLLLVLFLVAFSLSIFSILCYRLWQTGDGDQSDA